MSEKKTSCLKRTLWGCGCLTGVLVLASIVVGLVTLFNRPSPPDLDTLNIVETVGGPEESILTLPGPRPVSKPMRLRIEVSEAHLKIVPDSAPGQIKIDGEYDKANYRLNTETNDRDTYIEYLVKFRSNRSFNLIKDDRYAEANNIVLHLPRDIPMEVYMKIGLGWSEINFSGVPLKKLDAALSLGRHEIMMTEPNPIIAEQFNLDFSMAEVTIHDLQNYRFERARIDASMGESSLLNSGHFSMDTRLNLDISMGHLYLQVPDGTRFDSSVKAIMGGYDGPSRNPANEDAPLLTLRGSATMGGIQVDTGRFKPLFTDVLFEIYLDQGIEEMIRRYQKDIKFNEEKYRHDRHALRKLGYQILDMGKAEDALLIFRIDEKEHPKNPASHYALANALNHLGRWDEAVVSLEESLKVDPEYQASRELLQEIKANQEAAQRGRQY